ncbi:hypothetical protein LCGC14_2094480 [marine sediment metagenome]|uniref:DUF1064 domain-containing protein n=1 Tax=marine sediment metagenome TaxID=412755 RepID=A0A0F9EBP7_9ZZZZ
MEKLGFEKNKRLVRDFNNVPTQIWLGGGHYSFKSKFEAKWAKYLQLLKDSGEIIEWYYEPHTFYFPNEKTAPVQYTPDFLVIENDDTEIYQETKGYHDGPTNSKLRRFARHYPDEIIELVLMRMPKKGKSANRIRVANKYVRRIIDASVIFKQIGEQK